jgi:hypothetical protein
MTGILPVKNEMENPPSPRGYGGRSRRIGETVIKKVEKK